MTSKKKLASVLALILGTGALAGGIAYAQAASDVIDPDEVQEPGTPQVFDRSFSMLVDGGAFLGVAAEDISKENMSRYGMREVRGVGITQVLKDSPAEKAGLRKDDVILRFDGESVTSARKLNRLVSEASADQNVKLTISRGGNEQEIGATLAKHNLSNILGAGIRDDVLRSLGRDFPQMKEFPKDFPQTPGDGNFVFAFGGNRRIGVSTQPLTKQLADFFGVKDGGLLITSVTENSPAAKAGLKAGDVITAVDGEKVTSAGEIMRAINKKEQGEVSLTVVRDRNTRTISLTPEKSSETPMVIRPGTMGTRRIMIPSIQVPAVPEINIRIPRIVVPATPPIDVTVPRRLPRTSRSRVIII